MGQLGIAYSICLIIWTSCWYVGMTHGWQHAKEVEDVGGVGELVVAAEKHGSRHH